MYLIPKSHINILSGVKTNTEREDIFILMIGIKNVHDIIMVMLYESH